MSDNVTRIHPAPSIPNPLTTNPWAAMTDAELDAELLRTEVRLDAVQHTLNALTYERDRRDAEREDEPFWTCPDCGKESEDGEPESHICWGAGSTEQEHS